MADDDDKGEKGAKEDLFEAIDLFKSAASKLFDKAAQSKTVKTVTDSVEKLDPKIDAATKKVEDKLDPAFSSAAKEAERVFAKLGASAEPLAKQLGSELSKLTKKLGAAVDDVTAKAKEKAAKRKSESEEE